MITLKKLIVSVILIVFLMQISTIVYAYEDNSLEYAKQSIINALENFENEVDISEYNISKDDMSGIVTDIIEENPQLFYVNREYKVSYSEQSNEAFSIYFSFKYSDSELRIKVNDFNSRIQLITDEIMKSETNFDKIHSCHDYIVKNYSYDETKGSSDVYNMLLTGQGTCMAYTGLFDYVMKQCGIEATTAKSEQLNHIWNVVKLDGEYYNIDVTWDDPIGGVAFSTSHKYLLKSDYYFDLHKHEGKESKVDCTSTLYDSYKWSDEGILTQVEDVDDVFEYLTATMPAIFIISVISIIIIVISIIITSIRKRKRGINNPYY